MKCKNIKLENMDCWLFDICEIQECEICVYSWRLWVIGYLIYKKTQIKLQKLKLIVRHKPFNK